MRSWRMKASLLLTLLTGVMAFGGTASAAEAVELYTPYTRLTASPGQTIHYSVEVINNTTEIQTIGMSVRSMPADWTYEMTSGGFGISEIAVKPDEEQQVSLSVEVPLAVQKGDYRFELATNRNTTLPLSVTIAEAGTFRTELTTEQPNLEGANDASFTYTAKLNNKTADKQTYALRHGAQAGWDVRFTVGGKDVSSVVLEPNTTETLTVNVKPAANVTADKYVIPIEAASGSTGAKLDLEAAITGTYELQLTSSDDRLSTELIAGGDKKIQLVLRNTGSSELKDIRLSAVTPTDWEVEFEEQDGITIAAGESKTIAATFHSGDKAIAGDYVVGITANSAEVSDSAEFRVAVKTSVLWGWLGILIIAGVFGFIYYLFRKYGRR